MAAPARRPPVVLSVEQALSLPYATLRMVHLGWRVIRVEAPPVPGRRSKGDPNRSIGREIAGAGPDRCSYFVGPNVGKQAIAIDLKAPGGRALLGRLVRDLPVDVFCTNTMPRNHADLGIDHATLAALRPDLVWCSISALGLQAPDTPGYDPMIQALCGYMDLTGHPDGPPMQCGPPIIDLKAGDEALAQVVIALWERAETGSGRAIDISMARLALSWLLTFLPMLDMGSPASELRRAGNEHRQFIPVNAYPTRDGFIYLAVGSDVQWQRLIAQPMFASLGDPARATNQGRRADRERLHGDIARLCAAHPGREVADALERAEIPHAPITPIERVMDLPFASPALLRTRAPGGQTIRLPPPALPTPYLDARGGELPFAPRHGEHTDAVLAEIGLRPGEIADLRRQGVVA